MFRRKEKKVVHEDISESCNLIFVKNWQNHYKGLYNPNRKYKYGDIVRKTPFGIELVFDGVKFRIAQII